MALSVQSSATRILSADHVRVNRDRGVSAAAGAPGEPQPHIETHERGGVVQEVVVTCTCGKHIVLGCDYGP